jgi:hypothetical protein
LTRVGPTFAGIPGAAYMDIVQPNGHDTASVLLPFAQTGQYTVNAYPKTGALPADTFTIILTQNGVMTTLADHLSVQSITSSGFHSTISLPLIPKLSFGGAVQQVPKNDGQEHLVAQVTITNQGNVAVDSAQIVVSTTMLGTTALDSAPTMITNLAPGVSTTATLTFPITTALSTATSAPLKISGTYSAGTLSGNWSVTFRSVTLNH